MIISHKQTPAAPTTQRRIAQRTRGRKQGPATRLMSPSDFGELLKPFVFLDLFEHEGPPFTGGLHPHSGIATLTYLTEGSVNYIDPDNVKGVLTAGGVEWMQAGRAASNFGSPYRPTLNWDLPKASINLPMKCRATVQRASSSVAMALPRV